MAATTEAEAQAGPGIPVRGLEAALEASDGSPETTRRLLVETLRTALTEGRTEIRRRFTERQSTGDRCVAEQSDLMDRLIGLLADVTCRRLYPIANPTTAESLTLLATGGYGRGELSPCSDVDLLFLLPYKRTPRVEEQVEAMLYALWDLGLKVGHAVRSVPECMGGWRNDLTIRTSLLEARYLWGDRDLFDTFERRRRSEIRRVAAREFIAGKLAERDERHRRWGDSRYVLEPNLKEGKGGLRDLHTLIWITNYARQARSIDTLVDVGLLDRDEAKTLLKAQNFLRTLRCHLHYVADRAEERLTFDIQSRIARRMGYTDHRGSRAVERLMKHYFLIARDVGHLTRVVCAALEVDVRRRSLLALVAPWSRQELDGFVLAQGRIGVSDAEHFIGRPRDLIAIFAAAHRHRLDLTPATFKAVGRSLRAIGPTLRQDRQANAAFMSILTDPDISPEPTLRRMNEAGVLGRFIPDFGRVVAQMQFDMYHVFTVDEHTLFAIGILHRILRGEGAEPWSLATRLGREISGRRALTVAMFCHDIAKGRGGSHSLLGARVTARLAPRLGLSPEAAETAEWLVANHLLMSSVAFTRDLEDPKTIADFSAAVASVERLRLLAILTTADIAAVGPDRWNGWKASLIGQLYSRAREMILGGFDTEHLGDRVKAARIAARAALPDFSDDAFETFATQARPAYWAALDAQTHARHARLLAARTEPLQIDIRADDTGDGGELTVIATDHAGLLSRIAGALALRGFSVREAKLFTQRDGTAIDVFGIATSDELLPLADEQRVARLKETISAALRGEIGVARELARQPPVSRKIRAFKVAPRVLIDNDQSSHYTLIEVNGPDRPALLYDLTRALTGLGLIIASAKIVTTGSRAVDVFYVRDVFGLQVHSRSKLKRIEARLLEVLAATGSE